MRAPRTVNASASGRPSGVCPEKLTGSFRRVEIEHDKLLLEKHLGSAIAPKRLTTSEFLERWFAEHVSCSRRRTQRSYRSIIDNHIISAIGDKQGI